MQLLRKTPLAAALCLCLTAAGCKDSELELTPVEGTVTLDGKPLAGAGVLFQPEGGGRPATGITDAEGKFTLTTLEQGDGAHVGMNQVSVTKEEIVAPKRKLEEGEWEAMKLATPAKYASPNTSGLTVNVQPGMEPVKLELSR
jgi:hypothetical protein